LRAACPTNGRDYIGMIPPLPVRIEMLQIMRASALVSGTQLVGWTGNRPTNVPLLQQDTVQLILLLCDISNTKFSSADVSCFVLTALYVAFLMQKRVLKKTKKGISGGLFHGKVSVLSWRK